MAMLNSMLFGLNDNTIGTCSVSKDHNIVTMFLVGYFNEQH